jgi:CHAT domain-containing protein
VLLYLLAAVPAPRAVAPGWAAAQPGAARSKVIEGRIARHREEALRLLHLYRPGFDAVFSAAAEAQEKLALEREHFGPICEGVAESLALLGLAHLCREDFAAAKQDRMQEVAVKTKLYGPNHWQVTDARLALAEVDERKNLSAVEREQLWDAVRSDHEAVWYYYKARFGDQDCSVQKSARIYESVLGAKHRAAAASQAQTAYILFRTGEFGRAEQLARKALATYKALLGEEHPQYAATLTFLAKLRFEAHGDYAQAEAYLKQALWIYQKALGKEPPDDASLLTSWCAFSCPGTDYAGALLALGSFYVTMSDYARAEPLLVQAAAILGKAVAKLHPTYLQGLNDVGELYRSRPDCVRADKDREQVLCYAGCLDRLAALYHAQGLYAQAEKHATRAVALHRVIMGTQHPVYACSLDGLGRLCLSLADVEQAELCLRQAEEINARVFGRTHVAYAPSLRGLGLLAQRRGDIGQAADFFRRALEVRERALGKDHPDYAQSLCDLGSLYRERGEVVRAEKALQGALQVHQRVLGDDHFYCARMLALLADLYLDMGDVSRASILFTQAEGLARKHFDADHVPVEFLNGPVRLHMARGEFARAKSVLEKAVAIQKQTLRGEHPVYAASLNELGYAHYMLEEYDRAEERCGQAREILAKALGKETTSYAVTLRNLGHLYVALGQPVRAEPLLRDAARIRQEHLGEEHPVYADSLSQLGWLHAQKSELGRAESLLRQALEIRRKRLQEAAPIQSEHQQLVMLKATRTQLDNYLSVAFRAELPADRIYQEVLWWKGTIFARQRRLRLARDGADPKTARLFNDLQRASSGLASLFLEVPAADQVRVWRRALQALIVQREQLERELNRRHPGFRNQQTLERLTSAQLQAALPPDTALVDMLEYTHVWPPPAGEKRFRSERRVVAFVVRADRPVAWVDLGAVKPLVSAIARWRTTFTGDRSATAAVQRQSAAEVRCLLWQPLEAYVAGARAVLVSPDGALAFFPFAALPGRTAGTYLIEKLPVGVVSVPQLLPELLASPPGETESPATSLLLLGGVDFDARPASSPGGPCVPVGPFAVRGGRWLKLEPLPGTLAEAAAVGAEFRHAYPQGRVSELTGAKATAAAFRAEITHKRYLHLATHGFFAPAEFRSALAQSLRRSADHAAGEQSAAGKFDEPDPVVGLHLGVLSGLVLAGANGGAEAAGAAALPGDDSILTALEVAELDLRPTELVVLSACETCLGTAAGGEGVLGLQRAFQVSGARTVVASLWKVDDQATRVFMAEFYRNLWVRKMGKLAALSHAQVTMLRRYEPLRGRLRGPGESVRVPAEATARAAQELGQGLPPFYWAAFVLSGDWR